MTALRTVHIFYIAFIFAELLVVKPPPVEKRTPFNMTAHFLPNPSLPLTQPTVQSRVF